ncbi:hypothetical protein ACVWZ4_001270 [Bradyrhizobium sp. USDA 4472]
MVDKGRSPVSQHVRNDIEAIHRAGAEPSLDRICDLFGCAHQQAVAKRLNAGDDLANCKASTRQSFDRAMVPNRKRNAVCIGQNLLRNGPFEVKLLDRQAHASCKSGDSAIQVLQLVKLRFAASRLFFSPADTDDKTWKDQRSRRAAELTRQSTQALGLLQRSSQVAGCREHDICAAGAEPQPRIRTARLNDDWMTLMRSGMCEWATDAKTVLFRVEQPKQTLICINSRCLVRDDHLATPAEPERPNSFNKVLSAPVAIRSCELWSAKLATVAGLEVVTAFHATRPPLMTSSDWKRRARL